MLKALEDRTPEDKSSLHPNNDDQQHPKHHDLLVLLCGTISRKL